MPGPARGRVGGACRRPTVRVGIVPSASIQIVRATIIKIPTPDDHFTASPDCGLLDTTIRRVSHAGACIINAAGCHVRYCAKLTASTSCDCHTDLLFCPR